MIDPRNIGLDFTAGRLGLAVSIMRVWLVRRSATRMSIALGNLTRQHGAGSAPVLRAQQWFTTTQRHLASVMPQINQAEVLAGSKTDAAPVPPRPAEFSGSDGLPESDWRRAWAAAGAMIAPTFSQQAFSAITASNSFWKTVDTAAPVVQQAMNVVGSRFGFASIGLIVGVGLGVVAILYVLGGRR